MDRFELVSPYQPTGDQPQAIEKMVHGIENGLKEQTRLGLRGFKWSGIGVFLK